MKLMFLSIPDSVMNSHIYVLLQIQPSAGESIRVKPCLTRFKCFVEFSTLLFSCQKFFCSVVQECEVDVFEHPRFCDEFSRLVKIRFVANSNLCWSLKFDLIDV